MSLLVTRHPTIYHLPSTVRDIHRTTTPAAAAAPAARLPCLFGGLILSAGSTAGSNYFVRILSTLDREVLKPNTSVALHRHSHSVVEILPPESDSTIQLMQERPDITYHDIGGMDMQKQEVGTRYSEVSLG